MMNETKLVQFFLIFVTWERSCSVRNDRNSTGRTDITRLIISFRNYANARNYIESILKTKQVVVYPYIFKVQNVPGCKDLLNLLVKILI